MKLVDLLYWPLAVAGVVLIAAMQMFVPGAVCLGLALLVSLFQPQSAEGVQKLMVVMAGFCLIGVVSGFQPSWLPWAGVCVFGYVALTAKL